MSTIAKMAKELEKQNTRDLIDAIIDPAEFHERVEREHKEFEAKRLRARQQNDMSDALRLLERLPLDLRQRAIMILQARQ